MATSSAGYTFVVKTCPDMNILRQNQGIQNVTCASN
jgi:hypothetical protein